MPNAFRRLGEYLGLTETEEIIDSPVEEVQPQRTYRRGNLTPVTETYEAPKPEPDARIITILPRSFNDARQIGEEFRKGHAVIMNVSDIDEVNKRRLVDYASGLVHGLEGKIEKISNSVFLISPKNVDVQDDARATLRHDGFFNQS
ncbi:MAG: cell division protein SepF [Candidatus Nanopelagicales bacterium]